MNIAKVCPECGKYVSKRDCLCVKCSLGTENESIYHEHENPTFLLTNEIASGNINTRLRDGFEMFQEE